MIKAQRGATLPLALICLLATTVGALAASNSARVQQQQAANLMLATRSFQAAEGALRILERQLVTGALAVPPERCHGISCSVQLEGVVAGAPERWSRLATSGPVELWYRVDWLGNSRVPAQISVTGDSRLYRLAVRARAGRSEHTLEATYALTLR